MLCSRAATPVLCIAVHCCRCTRNVLPVLAACNTSVPVLLHCIRTAAGRLLDLKLDLKVDPSRSAEQLRQQRQAVGCSRIGWLWPCGIRKPASQLLSHCSMFPTVLLT
jgi:hypothetical protein